MAEIGVPVVVIYAFPLALGFTGLVVGWLAGRSLPRRRQVIDAGSWRAEYQRHRDGTEEWHLVQDDVREPGS